MDPVTVAKLSCAALVGVPAAVALTVTEAEMALGVTIVLAAVAGVVWAVRLEGRVNTLTELLERLDGRTEKIADRMGVIE